MQTVYVLIPHAKQTFHGDIKHVINKSEPLINLTKMYATRPFNTTFDTSAFSIT